MPGTKRALFLDWGGTLALTKDNRTVVDAAGNPIRDAQHTGFDNLAFWTRDDLVVVEDAGDTLHTQRNALDSAYLFDVRLDFSNPANQPIRILAQGRDPSATIDSGLSGTTGFQNDGDNEITGFHVSDGDPSPNGILGAKNPRPFNGEWRVFYTQQHGDNITYEIIPNPHVAEASEDGGRGLDREGRGRASIEPLKSESAPAECRW